MNRPATLGADLRLRLAPLRRMGVLAALLAYGPIANAGSAQAAVPTVRLISASLEPPAAAFTGSTARSTPATWVGTAPEIVAMARTLGGGRLPADVYALNVRDYVRNNIDVEFRFGLGKGARGAIIDQSGTAFDQAELMVRLLRQGGVAATYQLGVITLTPQQFGLWTGVVKGLNASTQAFTVDAKAACRLLADGGIPATVNGGDCTAASGDLTTVSLAHIWVSANGKHYDPSFKTFALRTGLNVPAAMGCSTCGADATSIALSGPAVQGVVNGVPFIQDVNYDNQVAAADDDLQARLTRFATSLQGAIAATDRLATLQDVVGGRQQQITPGPPPAPTLAYVTSTAGAWTDEIPDQYRTTLRVRTSFTDITFFGDELAGRRLRLNGDVSQAGTYLIDGTPLPYPDCTSCWANDMQVVLDVNHPYRANGGAYGDDHAELTMRVGLEANGVELPSRGIFPVTVIHGFGVTGPSSERHAAAIQEALPMTSFEVNRAQSRTILNAFLSDNQDVLAAKLLAQGAAADAIAAGLGRATITRHHDIGIVYAHPYNPASTALISLQSSLSVAAHQDSTWREPVFAASAGAWAMLEGSVNQQATSTTTGSSTATRFWSANVSHKRFLNVLSTQMASYFSAPQAAELAAAGAVDGYSVIRPEGDPPTDGAEIFYKDGALAYTIGAAVKGGGGFERDPVRRALDSTKVNEDTAGRRKYLAVSSSDGAATLRVVDLVTGAGDFPASLPFERIYNTGADVSEMTATTTSETELDGAGSASSSSSATWRYSGPDTAATAKLGGGWTHNYNVTAVYSGNGAKALGADTGIEASAAIAAIWSILDGARTPTFASRLTAAFTLNWLAERLAFNAVVVSKGGGSEAFQRLPDGTFYAADGGATLQQLGEPSLAKDFTPVTLKYTGRDGDVIDFDWAIKSKHPYGSAPSEHKAEPIFKASSWTFPDGVKLTFEYTGQWLETGWMPTSGQQTCVIGFGCDGVLSNSHPYGYVLSRVSNNLGRALTFRTVATTVPVLGPTGFGYVQMSSSFRIDRVTDETGRHVDYALSDCNGLRLVCGTFTVTRPDSTVETYAYASYAYGRKAPYRLLQWFTPSNQASPYQRLGYDEFYRVTAVTDALNRVTTYYPGALHGSEQWKWSQVVSPNQADEITTTVFNEKNNVLTTVDPLGNATLNTYDKAQRLTRTVLPEGNAQEKTYDARGNVTATCMIPKARAGSSCTPGLGDITTAATYGELPNVTPCLNPRTCNKPLAETDGRGFVTNYGWDAATGLLTQVRKPADDAGLRPQTDFGYTSVAGVGSSFSLLTSKTEKVSASQSLVTTFAYDPANKHVLKSATVDPAGVNITTCLQFDAVGNLTGVTDARALSCP